MDSTPVFVLYTNDGSQIVETIKTSLEKCDTTVYTANVLQTHVIDPPPGCATMLFLTPGMLSVLKSSRSPDLTYVQQNSKFCALFYHDTINIFRESVQELLSHKIPSFPESWTVNGMVRKVQTFILQILELLESENEEADREFYLVSNFRFYPDSVWKQNQDVFISFDSEIPAEDKIMVEIDGGMFEAKRINPYTYVFTFADCFGSGNRTVAVLMNEDLLLGTHQIVVKDGYQTLLDEINDVTSPLHYIQEILTTTQTNEGHLKSEMTNTLILEGTKNLIKKLHEKSDISGGMCSQMDQIPEKNTIMLEEGEEIVRRRSSRLTTRRRRSLLGKSDIISGGMCSQMDQIPEKNTIMLEEGEEIVRRRSSRLTTRRRRSLLGKTYKRQSQRVSCAHEYLSVEENLPSIKLNSDLLKSLPPDFFDVAQ